MTLSERYYSQAETPSQTTFARDFRRSAIIAAIVCVLLMIVRTGISGEIEGPFSFLPKWLFYSRLGIPLTALAVAFVYAVSSEFIRIIRRSRAQ